MVLANSDSLTQLAEVSLGAVIPLGDGEFCVGERTGVPVSDCLDECRDRRRSLFLGVTSRHSLTLSAFNNGSGTTGCLG